MEKMKSTKSIKDLMSHSFESIFEKAANDIRNKKVIIICGQGSSMKDVIAQEICNSVLMSSRTETTQYLNICEDNLPIYLGR